VTGGLFVSVFRREREECFIVLSRKLPGIFCGHSHVRDLPTQDVATLHVLTRCVERTGKELHMISEVRKAEC